MKQHGYIYRVTNLVNGTRYVGQRRGEFQSWYLGSGILIRRAVQKHGAQSFALEFVQSAFDQESLDRLEQFHIAEARKLGRTYNVRDGGLGSLFNGKGWNTGRKASAETRAKMSAAHSGEKNSMAGVSLSGDKNPMFGRHHSEETKRKIGEKTRASAGPNHGNRGKVRTAEMRARVSAANKGHKRRIGWKMTEEQKAKISAARKALFAGGYTHPLTEETRRKISEGRKRFWARKKAEVTP